MQDNKHNHDENKSAVIDIPVTRVFSGTVIKNSTVSFKRRFKFKDYKYSPRPSDANFQEFNMHNKQNLPSRLLKNDHLMLPYKSYISKVNKAQNGIQRETSIHKMYKIAAADLRSRLQAEKPTNDVVTVTDIDKDYFIFVETRSLPCQIPLFKSLKYHLNDILRIKQEIGYRKDCILQIDINSKKELKKYEESVAECSKQAKYFEVFISQDYEKSMVILDKYEKQKLELDKQNFELGQLANRQFLIMSRLINLDYLYSVQQKYGRFLFYLSPPTWRMKHRLFARSIEIEEKGFDFTMSAAEDTFLIIFEKLKQESYAVKPPLYFAKPQDLMNVFEGIEGQQLWNLIRNAQLAPEVPRLKGHIDFLKDSIQKESNLLVNYISDFKTSLEFLEERANYLEEKFYKILYGLFYESVGTPEVLRFLLHLEFCYESAYSDKPINSDVYTVGKGIESYFIDYVRCLGNMHSVTLRKAISQAMELDKRKFKMAENARRELRCFEKLVKRLLMSYRLTTTVPPVCGTKRKFASSKPKNDLKKPQSKKSVTKLKVTHSLTEAEREYLTLFTDWSPNRDPADFLQSLSLTDEEIKRSLPN